MRFENQTFTTLVTLDYNEFINCTFEGCIIWYHGGRFHLETPKFRNARFAFGDAANYTLTILRMLRDIDPKLCKDLIDNAANSADAPPGSAPGSKSVS